MNEPGIYPCLSQISLYGHAAPQGFGHDKKPTVIGDPSTSEDFLILQSLMPGDERQSIPISSERIALSKAPQKERSIAITSPWLSSVCPRADRLTRICQMAIGDLDHAIVQRRFENTPMSSR